jgi:multiple sugar transport system substrate-binding protein
VAVKVAKAGGTPNRYSTFDDPELKANHPEWEIYKQQLKYADPDWRPIIDVWGEINQLIGVAVNKVLIGEMTSEEAMASIKEPVRNIMAKAGYYDGSNPMLMK